VIEKLLRFLEIDEHQYKLAEALWGVLAPNADAVLDSFYHKVRQVGIEPLLTDDDVARLKERQKIHWERLFRARFDQDYLASVARIGLRHRGIGLDLGSYAAGYIGLKIEFGNVIVHSELPVVAKGLLVKTLDKFVAVDMALALSTYDAALLD
jgi:methyl-accepting chemotaxis protein